MKHFWTRFWPPLLLLVVISCLFEALVRVGVVESFLLPAPSEVFASLYVDRAELMFGLGSTAIAALIGLGLSFVCGVLIAVVFSLSEFLKKAFLPYAVFFQTVPIIALAPVLVIWFGFGQPTVVASAFIVSIFPVIANSVFGLQGTDPALLALFKLHRASRIETLLKLQLPAALPAIMSGLRIASGLAVIGAIVGEFIAGGGLGEVVDAARTQQRLDKVFAAVLLSSVFGLVLVFCIDLVSRRALQSWYMERR
ncbi:MAG: ABC transporter permease [Bdellovibrionales bacterium]|nr:ABC transporter permease [Bdellovibrionales bacterium]